MIGILVENRNKIVEEIWDGRDCGKVTL